MSHEVTLASLNDLDRLSRALADVVRPVLDARGCVIHLEGELGAGKTTLVKALASEFGVDRAVVSSPTFVLENEYEGAAKTVIRHWDLYRVRGTPLELFEPVVAHELRLIEWATKGADLPEGDLTIELAFAGDPECERRLAGISGALANALVPLTTAW